MYDVIVRIREEGGEFWEKQQIHECQMQTDIEN